MRRRHSLPGEVVDLVLREQLDFTHRSRLHDGDVVVVTPQIDDVEPRKTHRPLNIVVRQVALLVTDTRQTKLRHTVDSLALDLREVQPRLDIHVERGNEAATKPPEGEDAHQRTDEQPAHHQRDREARLLERVVLAWSVDHDDLDG